MRKAGDAIRFYLPPEVDPDRTVLDGIIYEVVNPKRDPAYLSFYLVTVSVGGETLGGAQVMEENIVKE